MKHAIISAKGMVLVIVAMSIVCTVSVNGSIEKTITKSFDVGPGGTLSVDTDLGSIEVEAIDKRTVDIQVLLDVRTIQDRELHTVARAVQILAAMHAGP